MEGGIEITGGGHRILTILRSAVKGGHTNSAWKIGHDTHLVGKMSLWD